jgi:hypothetical protein
MRGDPSALAPGLSNAKRPLGAAFVSNRSHRGQPGKRADCALSHLRRALRIALPGPA